VSQEPENPYRGVIAITGLIGSGKTTVSKMLEKRGAVLIYADALAREVLEPGYARYERVKSELIAAFSGNGEELFDSSGALNRAALGRQVFSSEEKTSLLNSIVHPEVRRLFIKKRAGIGLEKVVVYDVPLLYETAMESFFDMVVVVYAPLELCLKRASERLNISEEEAKNRATRQISIEKKRQMADYVVENQGSLQELKEEADQLWEYLQKRENSKEGAK